MYKKVFIVLLIVITLIYCIKVNKVNIYENFQSFTIENPKKEMFLDFQSDYEDTSVQLLNKNNKTQEKYIIKETLSTLLQFSQIKSDYSKIYINHNNYKNNKEIFYYDIDENRFNKETLPISDEYHIVIDKFYSDNILMVVEDKEGRYYFYDYTNDILYEKSLDDILVPNFTIIVEIDDYIYLSNNYSIIEYNKKLNDYKVYGGVEGYKEEVDAFSPVIIPYNKSVLVNPLGTKDLYQLKEGILYKKFQFNNSEGWLYDMYHINDSEILFSFSGDAEIYYLDVIKETYKKIEDSSIKKDFNYELLYMDNKYFYIRGRKGSSLNDSLEEEFLIFDKNTYELVYTFIDFNKASQFFIKR